MNSISNVKIVSIGSQGAFTPGSLYFVPKLMIRSESICVFFLGCFGFTLRYCEAGPKHTPSQGFSYGLCVQIFQILDIKTSQKQ